MKAKLPDTTTPASRPTLLLDPSRLAALKGDQPATTETETTEIDPFAAAAESMAPRRAPRRRAPVVEETAAAVVAQDAPVVEAAPVVAPVVETPATEAPSTPNVEVRSHETMIKDDTPAQADAAASMLNVIDVLKKANGLDGKRLSFEVVTAFVPTFVALLPPSCEVIGANDRKDNNITEVYVHVPVWPYATTRAKLVVNDSGLSRTIMVIPYV